MHIERILIVEDDQESSVMLAHLLANLGYTTQIAPTLQSAQATMEQGHYDLVFSDLHLPDGTGIDVLKSLPSQKDPPLVIVMSGGATLESAIEAIRLGAVDYLLKPFTDHQIELALKRLEHWKRLTVENAYLRRTDSTSTMIGSSPRIQEVQRLIQQVAPTAATVLIQGENGTGKEMVARAIVDASPRCNKPFIAINCAAMPEHLIESELFGHEKGAFTGALAKRIGRFEMADGGTLLLDEISEMPLHLQAKLLRVLQEREIERVGGNHVLRVDVRVIATTNRDLKACVQQGKFREDLFYRLNVVAIHMPSLRERAGDVELLVEHFLRSASKRNGKTIPTVSERALRAIFQAKWPGNVRELQNAVERAVILGESGRPLEPADFGLNEETSASSSFLPSNEFRLEAIIENAVQMAMQKTGGNKSQAAKLLGISLPTLRAKLSQIEERLTK